MKSQLTMPPTAVNSDVQSAQYLASEWPRIAPLWAELADACERCSFFLTPAWVETWIEVYGPLLPLLILVFRSGSEVVGACVLTDRVRMLGPVGLRRIAFNTSGEDAADSTYIEFNHLLCRPGWDEPVASALSEFLLQHGWDEFALDGFCPGPAYDTFKQTMEEFDLEESRRPSYYVDLAGLRRTGLRYLESLSGHHRKHVRANSKLYCELGPLELQVAESVEVALDMFTEMALLNHQRCEALGLLSVFRSHHFTGFHRALIRRYFDQGSVRLLQLTVGSQTVGVLYNLVHEGKVYAYQSGFRYLDDKRLSPGMITYQYAIQYYLDQGLDDFDFLAGDVEYKRRLSSDSRDLLWAVFRKSNWKLKLVDRARQLKTLHQQLAPARIFKGKQGK